MKRSSRNNREAEERTPAARTKSQSQLGVINAAYALGFWNGSRNESCQMKGTMAENMEYQNGYAEGQLIQKMGRRK